MPLYFISASTLTHCGMVMPYSTIELGQYWLKWLLVAWQHQAITSTSTDQSSARTCDIHFRAISLESLKISIVDMSSKMTDFKIILVPAFPRGQWVKILWAISNDVIKFIKNHDSQRELEVDMSNTAVSTVPVAEPTLGSPIMILWAFTQ